MPVNSEIAFKAFFTRNALLKLLCLAMAISIWCLSSINRKAQIEFSIPLKVIGIPAGYVLSTPPPAVISYTLSGSPILINGILRSNTEVKLSMAGAVVPGKTIFLRLESYLKLPEGTAVTRISPAVLELNLESGHTPSGGQPQ